MAVVRQRWDVFVQPLEELSHFASSMDSIAADIFNESAGAISPFLLDELRFYPPVPPNSRYRRTFRLRDGWVIRITASGGLFRFEVSNDVDYTVRVVGSLAQTRDAAARFQREFHASHGWLLAQTTVSFWFHAFVEEYQSRFEDRLAAFSGFTLTKRARTALK